MRRRVLAVALALAALGTGCEKKKQKSGGEAPAAELSEKEREREAKREAWAKADPQQRRRLPVALDLKEGSAQLPQVPGAVALVPAAVAAEGKQVTATLCLTAADPAAAAESLKAALETGGWNTVSSRPHRTEQNKVGMSAQKPPYRIAIAIVSDDRAGCAAAEGKIAAEISLHKLLTPDQAKTGDASRGR